MLPCQRKHFLYLLFVFWCQLLVSALSRHTSVRTCKESRRAKREKTKDTFSLSMISPKSKPDHLSAYFSRGKPSTTCLTTFIAGVLTWLNCASSLSDISSVYWWRCCKLLEDWWALLVFVCIFCEFPVNKLNTCLVRNICWNAEIRIKHNQLGLKDKYSHNWIKIQIQRKASGCLQINFNWNLSYSLENLIW